MNIYKFDVKFTTGAIYAPDFVLVVNDHNSTTFQFTFDQKGRYVFKLLYPDGTIYVQDIIDNELTLTKGVLNQSGNYKFEISLYDTDNRLTTARIKEFPVRQELVETDETVKADDRVPILDNLIEETNKIVEAAKNGDLDGATFTPSVSEDGDLSWTNDKGKENPPTVNIAGPPGAPGAVKMQVVDTLPDVGETDTIYLLKKDTPGEQNLYDEYVYTETTGWEHIGDTSVDLTNYYDKDETNELLDKKQDKLIAGDNIKIENNIISAISSGIEGLYSFVTQNKLSNLDETDKINMANILKDAYTKGYTSFGLLVTYKDGSTTVKQDIFMNNHNSGFAGLQTKPSYLWLYTYACSSDGRFINDYYMNLEVKQLAVNNIIWNGDTPTVSSFTYYDTTKYAPLTTSVLTTYNTTPYTPSKNYHPATKKYVDDLPKSYTGYDATKTQVLKNVNGTLTWVDE